MQESCMIPNTNSLFLSLASTYCSPPAVPPKAERNLSNKGLLLEYLLTTVRNVLLLFFLMLSQRRPRSLLISFNSISRLRKNVRLGLALAPYPFQRGADEYDLPAPFVKTPIMLQAGQYAGRSRSMASRRARCFYNSNSADLLPRSAAVDSS